MARYFLGVDIGNTKSHALIADEAGTVQGVGLAGPGNHESLGKEGFRATLSEVIHRAVMDAGIARADITAAGYGIAGYDWSEDLPLMHEVIQSLGLEGPYGLVN
ncbi:MAG: ATPase, partial [Anaerolineae bacterium]|nr:ATPase [Anaerolineae bacterium]